MSWISKNKKKKTKTLHEISKCAINVCVVVLPLGVKILLKIMVTNKMGGTQVAVSFFFINMFLDIAMISIISNHSF